MTDIVERLREGNGDTLYMRGMERLVREAADEIERLRGALATVAEIASVNMDDHDGAPNDLMRIFVEAQAALNESKRDD